MLTTIMMVTGICPGDTTLKTVANLIRQSCCDSLYFGMAGKIFILLPETIQVQAKKLLSILFNSNVQLVEHFYGLYRYYCQLPCNASDEIELIAADAALYSAKGSDRICSCLYSDHRL